MPRFQTAHWNAILAATVVSSLLLLRALRKRWSAEPDVARIMTEKAPSKASDAGTSSHQTPAKLKERSLSRSLPRDCGFACFLSHFKVEAATEARWLQQQLEEALGQRCFLDSDDLVDLSKLKEHVCQSKVVLLLQTQNVMTRPYCILELTTAIDNCVPILGVSLTSGSAPYDFKAAAAMMTHLDSRLDTETKAALTHLGVDVVDAAFKLSNTLPAIISVPLNMNESRNVLSARIDDIVSALSRVTTPPLPDKATWLASRGTPPQVPHAPAASPQSELILTRTPTPTPTLT